MERPARYWKGDHFVIGASDFACLLGIEPADWDSRLELYEVMRGERDPKPETYGMRRGTGMETIIANEYALRHPGLVVRKVPEQVEVPFVPWLRVSLDREVLDPDSEAQWPLECKFNFGSGSWGDEDTDEIPVHYYPQVQIYAYAMGAPFAHVAGDVGGDYGEWVVPYDHEFVTGTLLPVGEEFVRMVTAGERPRPLQRSELNRRYDTALEVLEAGEAQLMDVRDALKWKAAKDAAERDREACVFRLERVLEEAGADVLEWEGERIATYKKRRDGKRQLRLLEKEVTTG